jgi:hypothetical protein
MEVLGSCFFAMRAHRSPRYFIFIYIFFTYKSAIRSACDGVRLCLCGTAAANGPIVRSPYDTRMNEYRVPLECCWQEKTKWLEYKSIPVPLCSTNLALTALGANPCLRGEKPTTKCICSGTVLDLANLLLFVSKAIFMFILVLFSVHCTWILNSLIWHHSWPIL